MRKINLVSEFEKHEKKIGEYISRRISGYYSHKSTETLFKRIDTLYSSQLLVPQSVKLNQFLSNVTIPVVLQRALLRRAVLKANYRDADLYSLSPVADTPAENARKAERVLNSNFKAPHVQFREKTFYPLINRVSRFGSGVTFTYWKRSQGRFKRTLYNPATGLYDRADVGSQYENAYTANVDVRDYFQNPEVTSAQDSDFQGHLRNVHVSELYALLNDESYIPENVNKALEAAKKGKCSEHYKNVRGEDERSWGVEIARFEGTINIDGNEDSDDRYFVEMIGDIIIRFSVDDYDENIKSYTVYNLDKRIDAWYGTTDCEYVINHEAYLNTILGMTFDNAMRAMNQYIFFDKKAIDIVDIDNRNRNMGFIPVDANNMPINNLISGFQPGRMDFSQAQYAINMIQQSVQDLSTKTDLTRKPEDGGLNNRTATAANLIAGQSDMLEADLIENFNEGVKENGYKALVMLRQFLPSSFFYRKSKDGEPEEIEKMMILGDVAVELHTTLQKNKAQEANRLMNFVTWYANLSQYPFMQELQLKFRPVVQDIIAKTDIPLEQIMGDEQDGMPGIPPAMPQMPGGMPGVPVAGGM